MSTYLVTGAMGCIGSWVLHHLVQQGKRAISFDLSTERHRLDLLMSPDDQSAITFVRGDLTNTEQVQTVVDTYGVTHVIHLAALQVPMCKANPVLGAQVNVTGTANIFEAVRKAGLRHVVYASSVAVYGPPEDYPMTIIPHDGPRLPRTLYGVYKVANEEMAKVYWRDHAISSTALRPYAVYGLGRDQGVTSEPTQAMRAAAVGTDFHISFGGRMQFHYAPDIALQFIAAVEQPLNGAYSFNMSTEPVAVQTVADIIMKLVPDVTITIGDTLLPFPEGCESFELHRAYETVYETPLEEAIAATIDGYRPVR